MAILERLHLSRRAVPPEPEPAPAPFTPGKLEQARAVVQAAQDRLRDLQTRRGEVGRRQRDFAADDSDDGLIALVALRQEHARLTALIEAQPSEVGRAQKALSELEQARDEIQAKLERVRGESERYLPHTAAIQEIGAQLWEIDKATKLPDKVQAAVIVLRCFGDDLERAGDVIRALEERLSEY